MIAYHQGGVAISKSGTVFLDGDKGKKQFLNPVPSDEDTQGGLAFWGSNNMAPQEMSAEIEKTGILNSGIIAKARIAIGKGPMPARIIGISNDGYEELEFIKDSEISDWLEESNSYQYSLDTVTDLYGKANSFTQLLTNKNRSRIELFRRLNVDECRLAKVNEKTKRIEYLYMSSDWQRYSSTENALSDPHMSRIDLLDREFPQHDLPNRSSGQTFALALQYGMSGRRYYPYPTWMTQQKWVKIAQGVPEMKEAMFKNQMTLKYVVSIHPEFWPTFSPKYPDASPEEKKKIQTDFYDQCEQYLVGGENAYKSFFTQKVYDRNKQELVDAVVITPVDDKMKDGKLLPDSAAANIEILLALQINSALFGVDMPGGAAYGGGAGSGSNIREAYLVQVMITEAERQLNSKVFNLAKRINGWDKDIVIRYPNQILTTLNTGKNTQPTA